MVNSEAKRAFGVNPSLFSSNKHRAHLLLTSPTRKAGRGGAKFVIKVDYEKAVKSEGFS